MKTVMNIINGGIERIKSMNTLTTRIIVLSLIVMITLSISMPVVSAVDNRSFELEVFKSVNVERAKYGLKPLIWDENVAAVARSHSIDMSLKGYFSHISPNGVGPGDRLKNAGITKIQRMGENIALCGSASRAMSLWMGSPGHRANILNPNYTHLGVGVCGYYWTQNFVAYSQNVNPASTTISLNKVGMNSFPDAIVGYGKQGAMTVTVTNKGNQATGALKISIFGTNANRFTLSATSIKNIAARGSASFSVKPKTGLAAGPYVAAVSVSGANVATQVFNVEFIVNKKLNYDIAVTGAERTRSLQRQPGIVSKRHYQFP